MANKSNKHAWKEIHCSDFGLIVFRAPIRGLHRIVLIMWLLRTMVNTIDFSLFGLFAHLFCFCLDFLIRTVYSAKLCGVFAMFALFAIKKHTRTMCDLLHCLSKKQVIVMLLCQNHILTLTTHVNEGFFVNQGGWFARAVPPWPSGTSPPFTLIVHTKNLNLIELQICGLLSSYNSYWDNTGLSKLASK